MCWREKGLFWYLGGEKKKVNRGLQLHDKSERTNLLHTRLDPRVVIYYVFLRFTFTIPGVDWCWRSGFWVHFLLLSWRCWALIEIFAFLPLQTERIMSYILPPTWSSYSYTGYRKAQENFKNKMVAPEVPTVSRRRKATATEEVHHLPQVQSLRSTDIFNCTFYSRIVDGK